MSRPNPLEGLPNPEALYESWWPIIIAFAIGIGYALRQYMRGARCMTDLKLTGKVAIITGGTKGIGKWTALDMAKRGARIYICGKDKEEGEKCIEEMRTTAKNESIFFIPCDLRSFKAVREFVEAFKKKETTLHYLIHNAAVMMCPREVTEDNFESQFQVNFLSPFLLTHLLLDMLKSSKPSRIINLVAPAYSLGEIKWDDINLEKDYTTSAGFGQSKLALVLFGINLAVRLEKEGVSVHQVLPGIAKTKIYRHMPFQQNGFVAMSFGPITWFLMKTADDGAQTVLYATLSELAGKTTGFLYKECAITEYDDKVKNEDLQKKLWSEALKMTNIKEFGVIE
ncbi:retinol dehydrogenase 12-like [Mytilus edulis]|uniref:retinol dehydrogenase 12-like n=1 Tax=Mytilus edulis TaxID=6550 RepID=UPI0039F0E84E